MAKSKKGTLSIIVSLLLILAWIHPLKAIEITISENGSGSTSEANVIQESQTQVTQTNTTQVDNNIETSSNTGANSASDNTSTESNISSGDATSQTSVENTGNISTINVGCCNSPSSLEVSGNGANSSNTVNLSQTTQTTITINNTATITNNIKGSASTGGNFANENIGGDVSITTGDIKVQSVVINAAVNNASVVAKAGISGAVIKIVGNGSNSKNDVTYDFIDKIDIYQNFSADIQNYIVWDLTTGDNSANRNSGGDVEIKTGDISLEVFLENFANLGGIRIDCCPKIPEKEEKEPPEEVPEKEEPEKGKEDVKKGQILPEAAAIEAGGPGIGQLAPTSSGEAKALFFILGLALFAIGGKIATNEVLPHSPRR